MELMDREADEKENKGGEGRRRGERRRRRRKRRNWRRSRGSRRPWRMPESPAGELLEILPHSLLGQNLLSGSATLPLILISQSAASSRSLHSSSRR